MGYYVLKYSGGRYGAVAWFKTEDEAQQEVLRIKRAGAWSGMPPKIEKDKKNPGGRWAHGTMSYRRPPGSVEPMTNNPISRRKARLILHEGQVRGHRLTERQRRFFGARASGYPMRNAGPLYLNARRGRRRRNPYHRNPGKGTNWLLIGGLAVGAFFLLPRLTASGGILSSLGIGTPAAVPSGFTPVGSGLYRAPNGTLYARNPSTGQMVPAPMGTTPTSAEDLLTRAGISLIPSVANNLASWIGSLFSTQQTSTGAVDMGSGIVGGTSGGGGSVTSPDVLSGAYIPPIEPMGTTGPIDWGNLFGGGSGEPSFSLWGSSPPPLTDIPTYPTYDLWNNQSFDFDPTAYDLPGMPPLDYDVGLTVGGDYAVIANPDDWSGYFGLGRRRR